MMIALEVKRGIEGRQMGVKTPLAYSTIGRWKKKDRKSNAESP